MRHSNDDILQFVDELVMEWRRRWRNVMLGNHAVDLLCPVPGKGREKFGFVHGCDALVGEPVVVSL